ncbi:DUF3108 domain-containing protein [Deinococcus knuensis]|uniref:DUF3108 domain-containing protein n=1 Tax=Deinococcus knuensis TaxID=1837380 RepID=A0ABQ2SJG1_9DEIO|nr:hypothetical protein [Deinococcus knuensis]GGS31370.1 hypothetical protein GCM10008961_24000 [Deinococcus knuensis]
MNGPAPTPLPDGLYAAPEAFTLTLTLGGRYAGEQHWAIHPERSAVVARVQTDFGGVLPEIRRVQTSRVHPRQHTSLGYAEGDGRGRAAFEVNFDRRAGTVTLRQGRDEASAPLTTEYQDPVSLLLWLRALVARDPAHTDPATPERTHAQLTGGRVLIQRLPDQEIAGAVCSGFYLRPGGAYVFVEQAAPWRLTRLIQPTDFGPVEANVSAGAAHRAPAGGAPNGNAPRRRRA